MKPVSISNPIKQFSVQKSVAVASLVASLIIIAAVIAADYHFPDDTYGGENVGLAIVYNDTEVPIEAVVSWSVSGVIYTPNFTAYTKAVSNFTPVSTPSSPILSPAYTSITEISVTTATHSYGYTGSNAGYACEW